MAKKAAGGLKLYRNAGVSPLVYEGEEMEPGSEFRAALDPDLEVQLLAGGHIEILEDQSAKADRAQAEAAGEEPVESTGRRSRRNS